MKHNFRVKLISIFDVVNDKVFVFAVVKKSIWITNWRISWRTVTKGSFDVVTQEEQVIMIQMVLAIHGS